MKSYCKKIKKIKKIKKTNLILKVCFFLFFIVVSDNSYSSDEIIFNTEVLSVNDRENIDLSKFSRVGYIMPGTYGMVVHVNKMDLSEQSITFYSKEDEDNDKGSLACVNKELTSKLGIKDEVNKKLTWWHDGECLNEDSLPGTSIHGDLSTSSLYLTIPQAYLEYSDENWDPPSRWDKGIAGLLIDYNMNAQVQNPFNQGEAYNNISGNGAVGINVSEWRFRADWQSNINNNRSAGRKLNFNSYYAYRPLASIRSKLTIGESYLGSSVFDSFAFTGASLVTDDNMLPPNIRGYAPEITGIAKSNAKVVISQQGRVLYETTVPAGPFNIRNLNNNVSGELKVRVEEQDGTIQEYMVNSANIPYLTRPGTVRLKIAAGQPSIEQHKPRGPNFGTGEFSWGVSNGWSLFGGLLAGGDYNAISIGIGRDLMEFGAISLDTTQSRTKLPQKDETLKGGAYRVSYSKSFDDYDSQISFAGYRFSDENFMNMSEYLDSKYNQERAGKGKSMFTLAFNKSFRDVGLSTNINYSHESYWKTPTKDRYTLTISRYFDIAKYRNISLSVSAYRNKYYNRNEDGAYISLSIPWDDNKNYSLNSSVNQDDKYFGIGFYDRLDAHNSYQMDVGSSGKGPGFSGYFSHDGDFAQVSANGNYQPGRYNAIGMSAQGGLTLTKEGGAFHRNTLKGGTRLLIDTNGVPNVPIKGYGNTVDTNAWGKAVVVDLNSYYRSKASIDLNKLGDYADATSSVVQATLTEGAIGYRQFDVISGEKAIAIIRLSDGSEPPFAATVTNNKNQETGILNDNGVVYLSGMRSGEVMTVHWSGSAQCRIEIPEHLPDNLWESKILLPCIKI